MLVVSITQRICWSQIKAERYASRAEAFCCLEAGWHYISSSL